MWLVYQGEPRIVVSPPNKTGWRRVSFLFTFVETSKEIKQALTQIENYLIEKHNMKQNNDLRNWRWTKTQFDRSGFTMYDANVRHNEGGEEE